MKMTSTKVETTTNFAFQEEVAMGFHEEANAILLNTLIRQYSNPYLATLRELTSNARDSHIVSGQTRPVEVNLPHELSPALIIEDFGTGLSRNDLKLYGQFGQSTKRDSNDLVGAFGLGAKSPLAMSSQFTVSSVKNGKRNTVIIQRREDGAPTMGFLPETDATGEPNGVKITIPTSEGKKFRKAIEEGFFIGWGNDELLVDGEKLTSPSVYDTTLFEPLPDDLGWREIPGLTRQNTTLGRSDVVAVIGGVRYELSRYELTGLTNLLVDRFFSNVIINLENGEVEIHPSRETLIYDKRTKEYINARIQKVIDTARAKVQSDMDNATTWREAMFIRQRALDLGFTADYTFKQKKVEFVFNKANAADYLTKATIRKSNRYDLDFENSKDIVSFLSFASYEMDKLFEEKKTYILVTESVKPKDGDASTYALHTESRSGLVFARLMATKFGVPASQIRLIYVNQKAKQLDKWFLDSFTAIFRAADYNTVVKNERSRLAREARAAYVSTAGQNVRPRAQRDKVRIMRLAIDGRSTYSESNISDLNDTDTHVLLKAGENAAIDRIRNALYTQRGYDSNLYMIFASIMKISPFKIIIANKSMNTKHYAAEIPNLVTDVEKFLTDKITEIIDSVTDDEKIVMSLNATRKFSEVQSFIRYTDFNIDEINDAETQRQFTLLTTSNKTTDKIDFVTWIEKKMGYVTRTVLDTITAGMTGSIASGFDAKIDIDTRYPMLESLNYYRDREIGQHAVDYINMMDTLNPRP